MRDGFTCWAHKVPPTGALLKIYCDVKNIVYSKVYTREEIEAWDRLSPDDPVDWNKVGWKLTGIARMQLEGA